MGNAINVNKDSLHDNLNINTMIPTPNIRLRVNIFMFKVTVSVITVVSEVKREVMSPSKKKIYNNFYTSNVPESADCQSLT